MQSTAGGEALNSLQKAAESDPRLAKQVQAAIDKIVNELRRLNMRVEQDPQSREWATSYIPLPDLLYNKDIGCRTR